MNDTIYDDGTLTVTPTEIRAKGFVLYTDNVSSISVITIRPGKGFGLSALFAILMMPIVTFLIQRNVRFVSFLHQSSFFIIPAMFALPFGTLGVLAWLIRISRLSSRRRAAR